MVGFLNQNAILDRLIQMLFMVPIFLISLSVHECAHAYAAYKLGDPTARNYGRVTLNPLKHVDIIGIIMLLIVGVGWAKPVPIEPRNFNNYRKGIALTAAAGPASNILMGTGGIILYRVFLAIFQAVLINAVAVPTIVSVTLQFLYYFAMLNLSLAFFNLIPLPPLDGSRLLELVLPPKAMQMYYRISPYSFIIIMGLMYTNILTIPINFCVNLVFNAVDALLNFVPFL